MIFFVALKVGDIMKKFFAVAALIVGIVVSQIVVPSQTQAVGNFSDWKCSQCGKTRNMAGQHQPPTDGCKVSSDGKHIWFKI